ncbi:hypothetical protein [Allofournierella sp.]|uniref:hypothetical protein n=1 Tax=Allofournierella sp. TaxID=1940256 RepID=UPI003AF037F6
MITFILLLAAALALAALAHRDFAETLPPAALAAALLTYACTVLRHKSLALPLAALVCAGLLCLLLWRARAGSLAVRWGEVFSPAFAALAAALAIAWICVAPQRMAILDDLVHWALNAKQLCFIEHFPTAAEIASTYGDYPPGGQLLGIFLHLGRPFSKTLLYWSNLLLLFALELPLLGRLRWRKKFLPDCLQVLGGAAALLAFPALYNHYYTISLVTEPLMALLLGYALYMVWECMERPEALRMLGACMALCLLALAKNTGLAYLCFGLVGAAILWGPALYKAGRRGWAAGAAFGALPLMFWYSWKWLCTQNGTVSYFTEDAPAAYTWQHVKAFLQGEGLAGEVIPHFVESLFFQPLNKHIGLSALGVVALVWLAVLWARRRRPEALPRRFCAALGALTGCFAVYAASVCYSYVYLFDEWEAETLSAFSRYLSPLPTAMLLLALGPVLGTVTGLKKRPRAAICAGCAAALLVCAGPLTYWTPAGYEAAAKGIDRQQYEDAGLQCGAVLQDLNAPERARMVLVTEGLATDRPNELRKYFLLPVQTLNWSEAQYGSREKAGEAWQNALVEAGYNYVWCAPESGPTLEAYGMKDALGAPLEPGAVYAVTQDGRFELERLE